MTESQKRTQNNGYHQDGSVDSLITINLENLNNIKSQVSLIAKPWI